MSDKLPFEDAFERRMSEGKAPFEDASWEKMNRLLDEKEERRPFAFWWNFRIWGLAACLVAITAAGHWYLRNKEHTLPTVVSEEVNPAVSEKFSRPQETKSNNAFTKNNAQERSANAEKTPHTTGDNRNEAEAGKATDTEGEPSLYRSSSQSENIATTSNGLNAGNQKKLPSLTQVPALESAENPEQSQRVPAIKQQEDIPSNYRNIFLGSVRNDQQPIVTILGEQSADSAAGKAMHAGIQELLRRNTNELNKEDAAPFITPKSSGKQFFLAAGVGLEQQLPLGGQKLAGFNFNGNDNLLTDYIPSLFLRFEKDKKLFVQSGFNYAAPRLVKKFDYAKQTSLSFASGAITTNTYTIRKTFYNEVPVSINAYLEKNWSVGAGMMFSWLHSTVAENRTKTSNLYFGITDSTRSELMPIRGFTDSFLTRSHTSLLMQTDVYWRRLSLGLRYSRDMDPYIRYTLPDGTIKNERGWSLDLVLRFRIWQSAKFSLPGKAGK